MRRKTFFCTPQRTAILKRPLPLSLALSENSSVFRCCSHVQPKHLYLPSELSFRSICGKAPSQAASVDTQECSFCCLVMLHVCTPSLGLNPPLSVPLSVPWMLVTLLRHVSQQCHSCLLSLSACWLGHSRVPLLSLLRGHTTTIIRERSSLPPLESHDLSTWPWLWWDCPNCSHVLLSAWER